MDGSHKINELEPHNIDAEQALLGAIFVNNEVIAKIATLNIRGDMFYLPIHAKMFDLALDLYHRGKVADPLTMKKAFENEPALSDVGGPKYLVSLASSAASIINCRDYAELVRDMWDRRVLMHQIDRYKKSLMELEPTASADSVVAKFEEALDHRRAIIDGENRGSKIVEAGKAIADLEFSLDEPRDTGISSGIHVLDSMIGGFRPGELILVAGRPGMCKTGLALNLSRSAAQSGHKVLYVSAEMDVRELAARLCSDLIYQSTSRTVAYKGLLDRRWNGGDRQYIEEAVNKYRDLPLTILDRSAPSLPDIKRAAMRIEGLDMIVVDYLGLMKAGDRYSGNRVQEVSEISHGLKNLAREMNIPVIALSQLNRGVESRDDKQPLLSDLRDSGDLEQDANLVLFVYREYYYRQKEAEGAQAASYSQAARDQAAIDQAEIDRLANTITVIVGKQRNGPTGSVDLSINLQTGSIGAI